MNSIHNNIKFTKEEDIEVSYFPFLNIKITKGNGQFRTSTYYKPTHTGVCTNWYSFTPRKYKKTTCWKISFQPNWLIPVLANLSWKRFPMVQIMIQKRFQLWERWKYFWFFRILVSSRYELKRVSLPFFKVLIIKLILKSSLELPIVYQICFELKTLYLKGPSVVYGIYCTNCSDYYVGNSKRHLKKRFEEHRDVRKPTAVSSAVS